MGLKRSRESVGWIDIDPIKTSQAQKDTLDAIKAALPEPVSLVKKNPPKKKKPATEFWCVIRGTKEGWQLDIRSNLPEVPDYDNISYYMESFRGTRVAQASTKPAPLDKYGECTLKLTIGERYKLNSDRYWFVRESSIKSIAEHFLNKFVTDYKRVTSPVVTVYLKEQNEY